MSGAAPPEISVIVPSYNSARTIGPCLESLLAQQTEAAYEIIVVDSSSDDTRERIAAFAPRVALVHSPKRLFPGPARNLGIGRARGNLIAFTDADCVVAPDWLEQIRRAHLRHDAVGGRIVNGTPGRLCGTALYLAEFVEFGGGPPRRVPSVPSCNVSYKRRIFDEFGLFPDVPWGEEYIFHCRLPRGLWFEPAIIVRHLNRTACAACLRHARTVGEGAAMSRRATGQLGLLFRCRILIPLLWVYRMAKIARAAVRTGQARAFLLASPLLAAHLLAWTQGFWRASAPRRAEGQR